MQNLGLGDEEQKQRQLGAEVEGRTGGGAEIKGEDWQESPLQAGEGRVAILGREPLAEVGGRGILPCAPTWARWAGQLPPGPWSPAGVSKLPEPQVGLETGRERPRAPPPLPAPERPVPCSGRGGAGEALRKEPSAEHPEWGRFSRACGETAV